jgi:hypothetical protein
MIGIPALVILQAVSGLALEPTAAGQAWTSCLFAEAKRFVEENAAAESVADAALERCDRAQGVYWAAIHKMFARSGTVADPAERANTYIATRRKNDRVAVIAMVLDYRATLKGT